MAFNFQHPDYKPLDVEEIADGKIIISRLTPLKRNCPGYQRDHRSKFPTSLSDIPFEPQRQQIREVL